MAESHMWQTRYERGDSVAVWSEMRVLSFADLSHRERADVNAVVRETIHRVKHNLLTLEARLRACGYRNLAPMVNLATAKSEEYLTTLVAAYGSLPLSVMEFYRQIADVNLMGDHPCLSFYLRQDGKHRFASASVETNPLVIWPTEAIIDDLEERGCEVRIESDDTESRRIFPMSVDKYAKHGYSGGDDVGVIVPSALVDGDWTQPDMPFVSYLRMCILEWGGFPGACSTSRTDVREAVEYLRADLIPF